jgi:anti-sigma-K factor RskA
MMATNHDAFHETSGLYVLGGLAPAERAAFEAHLAECDECRAEVRRLRGVADALLLAVPQVDPPAGLRDQVLSAVRASSGATAVLTDRPPAPLRVGPAAATGELSRPRRASVGVRSSWLAIAALLLLTAALGTYSVLLRQRLGAVETLLHEAVNRLGRTEQQLLAANRTAAGVQLRLAVLTAPDLRQVNLAGQAPAPRAAGRGFWSRSRGLVFAATELPPLPAGRTYQLWYLTASVPVSAGLFRPEPEGTIAAAFDPPPAGRTPTGLAVSLEPDGGVPAPTGAIYLAGATTQ